MSDIVVRIQVPITLRVEQILAFSTSNMDRSVVGGAEGFTASEIGYALLLVCF
jgi:hypothetical protein